MVSVLAVTFVVGVAGAGAGVTPLQPLSLQSVSVTQDGQDLVWSVELTQSFSPGALGREHESLCLLLARSSTGSGVARLCLAGPRRGERSPRVLYLPITPARPGRAVAIDATVTRSSNRELTASFLPATVGLPYRPVRWQVISTVSVRGCAPASPGSTTCSTSLPAKPTLLALHTPRLVGCAATGPDWVFTGPRNVHDIALTFDDGRGLTHPRRISSTSSRACTCRRHSSRSASTSRPTTRAARAWKGMRPIPGTSRTKRMAMPVQSQIRPYQSSVAWRRHCWIKRRLTGSLESDPCTKRNHCKRKGHEKDPYKISRTGFCSGYIASISGRVISK